MQVQGMAAVVPLGSLSVPAEKPKVGTPALGLGGSESPSAIRVL